MTAGVPTVWMAILAALDAQPGRWDLSSLHRMVVGGAAVPQSMIEGFERHGLEVLQAWGMTETSPLGTVCHASPSLGRGSPEQYAYRARQGVAVPLVEIRARNEDGEVPWDDETMGELEVRGPWVASGYHGGEGTEKFTEDGWFATGDVVTIDPGGCIKICDRAKDLVKSGGEWISSVDMENLLMAHPAVAEAAVIAVPDERWGSDRSPWSRWPRAARRATISSARPLGGLCEVAAARALRVRGGDTSHRNRQVEEDRELRSRISG